MMSTGGWAQRSVDADWGVIGTQLAELGAGIERIQVSPSTS
jgi:hypothetical protein